MIDGDKSLKTMMISASNKGHTIDQNTELCCMFLAIQPFSSIQYGLQESMWEVVFQNYFWQEPL